MQNTAQIIQFSDLIKELEAKATIEPAPLSDAEKAAFFLQTQAISLAASEQLEAERKQLKLSSIMGRAAIPKRFQSCTFDSYRATNDGQQRALSVCQHYALTFGAAGGALEQGASMVFCGLPGTGKTHLASAIAQTLLADGYTALYVTVSDYIRAVRETWGKSATKTENQVIADFTAPDLLIIDEIGASYGTEAEQVNLFELINKRYEEQKPILVISNLNKAGVAQVLGDRTMDRLREGGGKLLAFTWESARKSGGAA